MFYFINLCFPVLPNLILFWIPFWYIRTSGCHDVLFRTGVSVIPSLISLLSQPVPSVRDTKLSQILHTFMCQNVDVSRVRQQMWAGVQAWSVTLLLGVYPSTGFFVSHIWEGFISGSVETNAGLTKQRIWWLGWCGCVVVSWASRLANFNISKILRKWGDSPYNALEMHCVVCVPIIFLSRCSIYFFEQYGW